MHYYDAKAINCFSTILDVFFVFQKAPNFKIILFIYHTTLWKKFLMHYAINNRRKRHNPILSFDIILTAPERCFRSKFSSFRTNFAHTSFMPKTSENTLWPEPSNYANILPNFSIIIQNKFPYYFNVFICFRWRWGCPKTFLVPVEKGFLKKLTFSVIPPNSLG